MGCLAALFTLPAQAADEEALQLARDVIKLTRECDEDLNKQRQQQAKQALDSIKPKLEESELPAERKALIDKHLAKSKEFGEKIQEAYRNLRKEKLPVMYAKIYTIKELQAMKAFYESPEGRSIAEKRGLAEMELMPLWVEVYKKMEEQREKELEQELPEKK